MEPRRPAFPKLSQRFLQNKMRVQQRTQSIYDEHFSEAQISKSSQARLSQRGLESLSGSEARSMITNLLSAPRRSLAQGLPQSRPVDPGLDDLNSRLLYPAQPSRGIGDMQSASKFLTRVESHFERLLLPSRGNRLSELESKGPGLGSGCWVRGLQGSGRVIGKSVRRRKKVKQEGRRVSQASSGLTIDKHEILAIGDILGSAKKDFPEVDN